MREIAEKIAEALDRLDYPGGNALFLEEAMKAAGLVEIRIGDRETSAKGLMIAGSLNYPMPANNYTTLGAALESVFSTPPQTHTYQFDFKLLGSVTLTALDEATARDMAVDALTEAELSVCSGGNLPPTFTASLDGDLELMEVDGKDVA